MCTHTVCGIVRIYTTGWFIFSILGYCSRGMEEVFDEKQVGHSKAVPGATEVNPSVSSLQEGTVYMRPCFVHVRACMCACTNIKCYQALPIMVFHLVSIICQSHLTDSVPSNKLLKFYFSTSSVRIFFLLLFNFFHGRCQGFLTLSCTCRCRCQSRRREN